MIDKETFLSTIALIQEQDKINKQISDALELFGDGFYLFGSKSKDREALLNLLRKVCNDPYDYIGVWLYEDFDGVVSDDEHEWHLNTAEDLYDFLVDNQEYWKQG